MSTLTDRYVWAVLRAVPGDQRGDLEPEIRALVADAIEARADQAPAGEAERAALIELGDPDALATRYSGRPRYVVGPEFYPAWRRLLGVVLPIAIAVGVAATTTAAWMSGRPLAELVGVGITAAINVGVQTAFWITLVFAVLERAGQAPLGEPWTPDRLPEARSASAPSATELAGSVVALVLATLGLAWQQVAQPVTIDGQSYPLFDPALWSSWFPWIVGVLTLQVVLAFVRWRRGGWTWTLAVVNLGLNLAFVIPAAKLVTEGRLLDPGLVAALEAQGFGTALQPLTVAIMVAIVFGAAIDVANGFRGAAQATETRTR